MKMTVIVAVVLIQCACATAAETATQAPAGASPLVDMHSVSPGIHQDIRYATTNNFTGQRVAGYNSAKCLLHVPVAKALARVERDLRSRGYALLIYDCYRPTVAVADFMRWAADAGNQSSKAAYYPDLDKSALVPDYIAEKSGHSKGATVDVGLLDCRPGPCTPLDMGTAFDYFGPRANTAYPGLTPQQGQNRQRLLDAMAAGGFGNYPMEWWHFTWKAGPLPDTSYDFPID